MKTATRSLLRSMVEAPSINKFGMVGRPDEVDPAQAKQMLVGLTRYHDRLKNLQVQWLAEWKSVRKLKLALPDLQSHGSPFHAVAKWSDGKPEDVGDLYNSFDKEIETLEAAITELKKVK
jgi:hypothetical protein